MAESEKTPRRPAKSSRCAIYTRKSSDEGLEQAFNSLDAQREACAAFIMSQKHEGWTILPALYDDGGFSGGTMDRPALKRLITDIEAGQIDITIEYKWGFGKYDRLPELAAELAGRPVTILISVGGEPAALAAKSASATIPIVFMVGRDPVELGLVASYNRPGGNATGINLLNETIEPKRVGILRELLPQARTVAVLINPTFPPAEMQWREIEAAARTFGIQTQAFRARTDREIESAFHSITRQQIPALIVATDPLFVSRRDNLIALSEGHKVPTMYGFRDIAVAGGLISYGVSLFEAYRQVGYYAGRILKGAKAADLPVVQPTKLELVINLKTAKALNLNIPDQVLAIADEVIE